MMKIPGKDQQVILRAKFTGLEIPPVPFSG
jgi:hypothetical protein